MDASEGTGSHTTEVLGEEGSVHFKCITVLQTLNASSSVCGATAGLYVSIVLGAEGGVVLDECLAWN